MYTSELILKTSLIDYKFTFFNSSVRSFKFKSPLRCVQKNINQRSDLICTFKKKKKHNDHRSLNKEYLYTYIIMLLLIFLILIINPINLNLGQQY